MPHPSLRSIFTCLVSLILLCTGHWTFADAIDIQDAPSWSKSLAVPEKFTYPKNDIQNGIYYVLLDIQVRAATDESTAIFQHYAEHIVNQNGLEENSQLNISYDPAYEKLQLHTLHLIRNGKTINKIETAAMKILQREDEMSNLIYNGEHTLNIILDDVRVGDTIEYSFTRFGSNPVYRNIFGFSHYLSWSVPVGQLQLRILWGKPEKLHYKLHNSDQKVEEKNTQYGREYLLVDHNIPALQKDDSTPDWFDPWSSISFSEMNDWQEVAHWGLGLYDSVWQSGNALDAIVADINNNSANDEERISRTLQFVQNEIRYLGIELGENSHRPSTAFETFQRRYGDCKDKTVLLITMLRKMNIEAHPALVNTDLSHTLADELPSTRVFDHVITYVTHNDKSWWLDPTRTYQHGQLETIHQPDFGLALVLREQTKELQPMNPNNEHFGMKITDRFTLDEDTLKPVSFTTTSVYHGWNAESQRNRLARLGKAKLQQQYLEFFQYYYPQIQVDQEIAIEDNQQQNQLTVSEFYQIADFWHDATERRRFTTDFYANAITSYLDLPDEPTRKHPLYLTYPQRIHQTVEIKLSDKDWHFDNETFAEENPFFSFHIDILFDETDKLLVLKYRYIANADHVPAAAYPQYLASLNKVQDYLSYGIYQNYTDEAVEAGLLDELWAKLDYSTIIFIYLMGYLLIFVLWRIEQWRRPFEGEHLYYPVTLPKFIILWVVSLGFYPMYWFYRNFCYIRDQQKSAIMPTPRGIFYYFWYFKLWQSLQQDNANRHEASHLPSKALAVTLAVLFFIAGLASGHTILWIPCLIMSALLCLPLANYILFINREHPDAIRQFSRWRPRHVLLIILSTPILTLGLAQEFGAIPNPAVINGDRLWQRDLKQLQRQNIIRPGDDIQYFYSDAFLSIMDDGNGITQRHVFSYWKEEDSSISVETAAFDEIADFDVTQGKSMGENTVLNIKRKDGSDFILFLATDERGDKRFIKALENHVKQATSTD